jgi:hypothetical protein
MQKLTKHDVVFDKSKVGADDIKLIYRSYHNVKEGESYGVQTIDE